MFGIEVGGGGGGGLVGFEGVDGRGWWLDCGWDSAVGS